MTRLTKTIKEQICENAIKQSPVTQEPPMDFDDNIPFAKIGLQYPKHTINSI
jgi:hypothetical protein